MRNTSLVLSPLLTTVLLMSCEGQPHRREWSMDLVEGFSSARAWHAVGTLFVGDEEAWPYLGDGWFEHSLRNSSEGGLRSRWVVGPAAGLRIFVARQGDLTVTFRCRALSPTAPVRLKWIVNGMGVGSTMITNVMAEYEIHVPERYLRRGVNEVVVMNNAPARNGFSHRLDLRLAWEYIRFYETDRPVIARAPGTDGSHLSLPAGSQVDYYLNLPRDATLRLIQVENTEQLAGASLVVQWQGEGMSQPRVVGEFVPGGKLRAHFPRSAQGWGRLSLIAWSDADPFGTRGGLLLKRPTLDAPRSAPPEIKPPPVVVESASAAAHNVVVYLIDTLRADHLGCYGYPRDTTPNIDRFASQAVLFEDAQAQSPWTRPSVASIFTGLWPQAHNVNDDPDALSEDAWTLPEAFRDLGYETAAFVANGNVTEHSGFGQGFDYFEYLQVQNAPLTRATDVNAALVRWLDSRNAQTPLFLYLHTIDPHAPYAAPEPFRSHFGRAVGDSSIGSMEALVELSTSGQSVDDVTIDDIRDLYDAEVAANDHAFGALTDLLRARGLFDDSVIVVVSDHGEEFFDHGDWQHGHSLHVETLHVPLLVRLPGGQNAGRVPGLIEHVDIMPTLLRLAGSKDPRVLGLDGRALLDELNGRASATDTSAVAHMKLRGRTATSLIEGRWKAIQHVRAGYSTTPELFDRFEDPRELRNVAVARPITAARMARSILRLSADARSLRKDEMSQAQQEQVEDQLRALGYIR